MVDPLDEIFKRRVEPQARIHLAARIIEASQADALKKSRNKGIFSFWMSVVAENFLMPRPALAMTVIMIMGVYLGFMLEEAVLAEDDLAVLYIEDSLELGDWL